MEPLEAALAVLREAREPLHWTVIQDRALRGGYLDPFEVPDVRKRLLAALADAAREGVLARPAKGVYALP
ncbi:MAG TPA: hypothetical protein VEA19_06765 [Actinomycetota bacterium]|nr:hypothetical protein [Actinomycetota bacterium]